MKHLYFLEAVTLNGKLTSLGEELSKFPLDPSFSKALMLGYFIMKKFDDRKILSDVLKLVSILSTENIWMNVLKSDSRGQESLSSLKRKYRDSEGDHFGLVSVYDDWYSEKQTSNYKELNSWCFKHHL